MRAHSKLSLVICVLSALSGSFCFANDPANKPLITKDFIEDLKKRSKEIRMNENITIIPDDTANGLRIGNYGYSGYISLPLKETTLCLRQDGFYDVDSSILHPATKVSKVWRETSAQRGVTETDLNNFLDERFFAKNRRILKEKIRGIMRKN